MNYHCFPKKNRLYDVVVENDFYAWSYGGFRKTDS